jgi:hypothetical protein
MATYTSEEEANSYLGISDVSEPEIVQAEADLDDLALGAHPDRMTEAPFRKINPERITPHRGDALHRATCEQVRYRRLMGAEFFTRPQRDKGSAEGVSYEGTLPHIAPRATAILADVGLINKTGRASFTPRSELEEIGWEGSS